MITIKEVKTYLKENNIELYLVNSEDINDSKILVRLTCS